MFLLNFYECDYIDVFETFTIQNVPIKFKLLSTLTVITSFTIQNVPIKSYYLQPT